MKHHGKYENRGNIPVYANHSYKYTRDYNPRHLPATLEDAMTWTLAIRVRVGKDWIDHYYGPFPTYLDAYQWAVKRGLLHYRVISVHSPAEHDARMAEILKRRRR